MKQVQFKYCPNDAARELKEICVTLQNNGGDNCINELYNVLLDNNYIKPYDIKTLLDIDSNDKF